MYAYTNGTLTHALCGKQSMFSQLRVLIVPQCFSQITLISKNSTRQGDEQAIPNMWPQTGNKFIFQKRI